MKWYLGFVLFLLMVFLVTDAKEARPKRTFISKLLKLLKGTDVKEVSRKRNHISKLLELLRALYLDITQQTPGPTTAPPGCNYLGTYYPPNTEIYKTEDREANWCHGAYCDENGETLTWDNFYCFPTTTPEPTTPPPPTTPPGCEVNGEFFPPGSEISRGEDRDYNWCFGSYCDEQGNELHWDNFNCFPTTTPPTTTEPVTAPQTATNQGTKRKRNLEFLNRLFRQAI